MTAAAGAAVEAAIRLIIANKTAITEWVKERGDDCLFPFFSFSLSLLLVHKHTHIQHLIGHILLLLPPE